MSFDFLPDLSVTVFIFFIYIIRKINICLYLWFLLQFSPDFPKQLKFIENSLGSNFLKFFFNLKFNGSFRLFLRIIPS